MRQPVNKAMCTTATGSREAAPMFVCQVIVTAVVRL